MANPFADLFGDPVSDKTLSDLVVPGRKKSPGREKTKANPFADLIPGGKGDRLPMAEGVVAAKQPDLPDAQGVPGKLESAVIGAGDMASFGFTDEATGLVNATLKKLGGDPGAFWTNYADSVKAARSTMSNAWEHHPVATAAGEVAGMVPMLVAGGAGPKGADLLARGVRGAKIGAIQGGLTGAGKSEGNLGERAIDAGKGVLTGAGIGYLMPGASKVVGAGIKLATMPARSVVRTVLGAINPEKEAARRVVGAISKDTKGQPQRAVTMLEDAKRQGTPLIVADTGTAAGGRTTQALMRSAANTSPDARAALEPVLQGRFDTQNMRAATVIGNLVRTQGNATLTRDALEEAAQTSRKHFYDRAYADGAGGVWTPEIETLVQSPAMQKAMKDAAVSIQNKVATGRAMNPVSKNNTPTLEYWDQVKRNLDSAWNVAKRAGDKELAADLDATRRALVQNLDAAVPSYQTARGVAATLFKANDALDAGEKFVTSKMPIAEASKGLAKMTPEERALFREGFVSKFLDDVLRAPDKRNVLTLIQKSPEARAKINMVLGPGATQKLNALVAVESIMTMTKNALGNSTTARQLAEIGIAGGVGMGVAGGNPFNISTWTPQNMLAFVLAAGSRKGLYLVDQRGATRVGEMLASDDPQVLQKAIDLVARNPRLLDAVLKAEQMISRALLPVTANGGGPEMAAPVAADEHKGPDG